MPLALRLLTALLLSPLLEAKSVRVVMIAGDGASHPLTWENTSISKDAMIRYTAQWGKDTPDNRWAWSAIVRDGNVVRVVSSGGAAIPSDGFVITGHGESASWIKAHLVEGTSLRFQALPPFPSHRVERALDAVDPSRDLPAGGRQANQLVVFTPKRGATTGTNIFGREAVVSAGRITAITGGDSVIPRGGFVLSGHARGSTWICRECQVGDTVELNPGKIVLTRDRESVFLRVEDVVRTSRDRLDTATTDEVLIAEGRDLLRMAEERLKAARQMVDASPREAAEGLAEAETLAWRAAARSAPSPHVELRGVWVGSDSAFRAPDAMTTFFAKLRSANINAVFPQASGVIRLASDNGESFDFFIRTAHDADIEVHLWTWLPAHAVPRQRDAVLLETHPEWADRDRKGKEMKRLDPANPEARKALVDEAVSVVTRFRVDGIHLDWEGMSGGYSEASLNGFRQEHGYDPLERSDTEARCALYLWRTELIRTLARDMAAAVRQARPGVRISAALQCFNLDPAPGTDPGASHQWFSWVDDGTLDLVCPMVYAQQTSFVDRAVERIRERVAGKVLHCPGLILYPETAQCGMVSPFELLDQIRIARRHAVDGVVLFSYLQLWQEPWAPDERLLTTLREGPFRHRAALPWPPRHTRD